MTELVGILALPALLIVVGILFVVQYKLAMKERKWLGLVIPVCILVLYLAFTSAAMGVTQEYEVRVLEGLDGHGNILKMTIQQPKEGETVTHFSELMIYNKDKVLVDKIYLFYEDGKQEEMGSGAVYDKYIQTMLSGLKLDGNSWDEKLITEGVPFMGMMFGGNLVKALTLVFGVPFVLILFAGILPRLLNRKKIRVKALNKVDIQSLQELK